MALFDDNDTPFDAPDVGFDEAGEGGVPLSSGFKLWLRGGKLVVVQNGAGRAVLCTECPCPVETGTGTSTAEETGTGTAAADVEVDCCVGFLTGTGDGIDLFSHEVFTEVSATGGAGGCSFFTVGTVYPMTSQGFIEYFVGSFAWFWTSDVVNGVFGNTHRWCMALRCLTLPLGRFIEIRLEFIRDGVFSDAYTGDGTTWSITSAGGYYCHLASYPGPGFLSDVFPTATFQEFTSSGYPCPTAGTLTMLVYD